MQAGWQPGYYAAPPPGYAPLLSAGGSAGPAELAAAGGGGSLLDGPVGSAMPFPSAGPAPTEKELKVYKRKQANRESAMR